MRPFSKYSIDCNGELVGEIKAPSRRKNKNLTLPRYKDHFEDRVFKYILSDGLNDTN